MIFQHMLDQVLDGSKTQTRRLVKPGQVWDNGMVFNDKRVSPVYRVGQTLAVCPGRGKPQVARIRILKLWHEDVRTISETDARAEGWTPKTFNPVAADPVLWYLRLWASMYDELADVRMGQLKPEYWRGYLSARPEQYWLAWALQFELVKGDDDGKVG